MRTNAEKCASALAEVVMLATDVAGRESTGRTGECWAEEIGEAEERLAAALQGLADETARAVVAELSKPTAQVTPPAPGPITTFTW